MASTGPSSVEVCWEDQQGICEFGRLAARRRELAAELEGRKRAAEDAAEAAGELLALSDDEDSDFGSDDGGAGGKEEDAVKGAAVRLLEGECFVHYTKEAAEARLEELEREAKAAEQKTKDQLAAVDGRMAELKIKLYARLGRQNINLEEE
jgi:prefoldin subunit 4